MGGPYETLFKTLKLNADAIVAGESLLADDSALTAEATYRRTRLTLLAVLLTANVFGVLIAVWLSAQIARPLARAMQNTKSIAQGDLSQTLAIDGSDEISSLLKALAEMQDGLRDLVHRIREGVDSLNSATGEIAAGGLDLSERTSQQSDQLVNIAESLNQLAESLQQNAVTSQRATSAANAAAQSARSAGELTNEIIESMSQITSSSEKISVIVSLIDTIAFQTNILALNAAVEAARAGEHGRGFAVVASEVRDLAHRAALSAQEIKKLIEHSVSVVKLGAALVADAGKTMKDAVSRSDEVSRLITTISESNQRQTVDIAGLNESLTRISDSTHLNAAMVEQSAAAVNSLRDQGQGLDSAISVFKLDR